jgi:hypothetical protein
MVDIKRGGILPKRLQSNAARAAEKPLPVESETFSTATLAETKKSEEVASEPPSRSTLPSDSESTRSEEITIGPRPPARGALAADCDAVLAGAAKAVQTRETGPDFEDDGPKKWPKHAVLVVDPFNRLRVRKPSPPPFLL